MKHLLFILLSLFAFNEAIAQTLSGTVYDQGKKNVLAYATITISQSGTKIASVLSDKEGKFSVTLDSGTYGIKVRYALRKEVDREVEVSGDLSLVFEMVYRDGVEVSKEVKDEDADGSPEYYERYAIAPDDSYESYPRSPELRSKVSSAAGTGFAPGGGRPVEPGSAGKLTAGEVNDFSKWDLWGDLTEDELSQYVGYWNLLLKERYLVQVTSVEGLPLADRSVDLVNEKGEVIYSARTDNTGKAELWASLDQQAKEEHLRIQMPHNYEMKVIKRVVPAEKGVNRFVVDAPCNPSNTVDIAFVVDATGSMGDEMRYLTAELNDIIYKANEFSSKLDLRFGSVFYRDHSDAYLTRKQDFTSVLSESVNFISEQHAGGGGDYEEAVEVALDSAITTMSWSPYARTRILFLVLDAPPHQTPEINDKLKTLIRQAAARGIRIVPLASSGVNKATEYLLRSLALGTNGTYVFLTDHSGIGGSHITPSTDEYKVETLNDLLVRLIKIYTYMPACNQEVPPLDLPYSDSSVSYAPKDTVKGDSTPLEITWKFYPNPTRNKVTIEASTAISELFITDLSGKLLIHLKDIQKDIPVVVDMSNYSTGIYLIRYPVGDRWISGKLIVSRE